MDRTKHAKSSKLENKKKRKGVYMKSSFSRTEFCDYWFELDSFKLMIHIIYAVSGE